MYVFLFGGGHKCQCQYVQMGTDEFEMDGLFKNR